MTKPRRVADHLVEFVEAQRRALVGVVRREHPLHARRVEADAVVLERRAQLGGVDEAVLVRVEELERRGDPRRHDAARRRGRAGPPVRAAQHGVVDANAAGLGVAQEAHELCEVEPAVGVAVVRPQHRRRCRVVHREAQVGERVPELAVLQVARPINIKALEGVLDVLGDGAHSGAGRGKNDTFGGDRRLLPRRLRVARPAEAHLLQTLVQELRRSPRSLLRNVLVPARARRRRREAGGQTGIERIETRLALHVVVAQERAERR